MYRKIAFSKQLSKKEKLKRLLAYFFRRRAARILWNEQWTLVYKVYPFQKKPAGPKAEKEHVLYWKPFRRKVHLGSLRITNNISGISDPRIIPEEVFMSDIEPTLNSTVSSEYLSFKSIYNHWFGGGIFPRDHIHNIDGEWLDQDLNHLSYQQMVSIAKTLKYPLVLKPNKDTYGGSNVFFPKSSDELLEMLKGKTNYLVQEKLEQHEFFNQFNRHGINSLRVNLYRSVKDNQLHVINHALRMGVGGSLDNLSSGGIEVMIRKDGVMDGYALDGKGGKFMKHPDTGQTFDKKIPDFEKLKSTALEVAGKIIYARVICLDMCLDANGKWRMIEVNLKSTSLMFAQYHGVPFFGEFTDEVREYCITDHWALKQ